jgi:hypothetical protein
MTAVNRRGTADVQDNMIGTCYQSSAEELLTLTSRIPARLITFLDAAHQRHRPESSPSPAADLPGRLLRHLALRAIICAYRVSWPVRTTLARQT